MVSTVQKDKIGETARLLNLISKKDLIKILGEQKINKSRFGKVCVNGNYISEEDLGKLIAIHFGYEYIDLKDYDYKKFINLIPLDVMKKYIFVPYLINEKELKIAISDQKNSKFIIDFLEMHHDLQVVLSISNEERIREILKKLEILKTDAIEEVWDNMRLPIIKETEDGKDIINYETITAEESPVVKLIDSTIIDALNKRVSDIHFETSENSILIRYRIDGMLHQAAEPFDEQYKSLIVSRIKVMSELDISEKRVPQDGRFKLKVMGRKIDFRVSVVPSVFGENVVIRILDHETLAINSDKIQLKSMNLPKRDFDVLQRMIYAPYGMFLITGPTGSGKSTTLYKALSEINKKDVKIITIEDPVEYQLKGIVQIQVNEKKGLTFAKGLRSILRHDPDKILIGEIRDSETAQIALQSALTGHLVFTTVHANSAFDVINRFAHMGINSENLLSALNCIVAQRLVRVLCSCKEEYKISEDKLVELKIEEKFWGNKFYNACGCEKCNGTGYLGRKAIVEIIEMDDHIKSLILQKLSVEELKKRVKNKGTTFLRQAAINEVLHGVTTIAEANRITFT